MTWFSSSFLPQIRCVARAKFIAHLVNQRVANETLALQVAHLLLSTPSEDSVEIAVQFMAECGAFLEVACPQAMHAILQSLRSLVQDGAVGPRVESLVHGFFRIAQTRYAVSVVFLAGFFLP